MLQLILQSYTRPRAVISRVLAMDVTRPVLLSVALLLACVLTLGEAILLLNNEQELGSTLARQPVIGAALNFMLIFATAVVVDAVGRGFGGTGTFDNALKVSVWYSAVSILPNLVFVALSAMDVPATIVMQFSMMLYLVVVFSIFVQVLHGFESLFLTVLGVMGAGFIFGMILLFAMSVAGLTPTL